MEGKSQVVLSHVREILKDFRPCKAFRTPHFPNRRCSRFKSNFIDNIKAEVAQLQMKLMDRQVLCQLQPSQRIHLFVDRCSEHLGMGPHASSPDFASRRVSDKKLPLKRIWPRHFTRNSCCSLSHSVRCFPPCLNRRLQIRLNIPVPRTQST